MRYEGTKIVYEVGDFGIVSENKNTDSRYFKDDTICKCVREGYYSPLDRNNIRDGWYGTEEFRITPGSINSERKLRPATQEEINKATEEEKIMVGEYEVKFGSSTGARNDCFGYIKVGCVEVSKELFLKIGKKWGLI